MTTATALLLGAVAAAPVHLGHPQPASGTQPPAAELPLMPRPARVERVAGAFTLTTRTPIVLSDPADPGLRELAELAADLVREAVGRTAPISQQPASGTTVGAIALVLDTAYEAPPGVPPLPLGRGGQGERNRGGQGERNRWGPGERYRLEVRRGGVRIVAADAAGLFYGLQTLRQLIPPDGPAGQRVVPAVTVVDQPRFRYRGMHLDVGRHRFPVAFIKRYVDLLARHKLNVFHWHLTEDQGWRIEIRKYPRLTQVGAWRRETIQEKNFDPYVGDGIPYGGFYTQDEVRDVVEFARRRHVTVIPEIELPGHSAAALAAYPELACTAGPFEVGTVWGVYEDVYCPTERTFVFLEDVLTEVLELFPSPYVHIGGDEMPKTRWKESAEAQALMRREGLKDEAELQSWFIRRIERFLVAKGRRLIGWDEILEGGLAPEATVMSWRGIAGGIAAAQQGHDAIMTPVSHLYFDYYQGDPAFEPLAIGGFTPLEKVYSYEPIPDTLTPQQAAHILGAQGNVWTEYMKTPEHVEYMVLPRMLALAEVVWSPAEARDWASFVRRLAPALRAVDRLGVKYRVPHVRGLETDRLTLADHVTVRLETLQPEAAIRYTTDATVPDTTSIRYARPVRLPVTADGVTVTARAFLPGGRASPARAATFRRATLRPALADTTALAPGLRATYHELAERVRGVAALDTSPAAREAIAAAVALRGDERAEWFGWRFAGYVRVPEPGIYSFTVVSDDGSTLSIGDTVVVDFDGYHGEAERSGQIALAAGVHPIVVRYFQATGGRALALRVAAEGEEAAALPSTWLFHRP